MLLHSMDGILPKVEEALRKTGKRADEGGGEGESRVKEGSICPLLHALPLHQ